MITVTYTESVKSAMKLVLLPTYGSLYELESFIDRCHDGSFIDYDGTGYYATSTEMDRDAEVRPSDILKGKINHEYTHVMWFNK